MGHTTNRLRPASYAVALAVIAAYSIAVAPSAAAGSIMVTNLQDSGAGSLRAALDGPAPGSTVTFASNLAGTIALLTPLALPDGVTIKGPGARRLTLSGQDTTKILEIEAAATATVSGLTLAHGRVPRIGPGATQFSGDAGGPASVAPCFQGSDATGNDASLGTLPPVGGGAIDNAGTLTLRGVTVANNAVFGADAPTITVHGGAGGEGSSAISCSARGGNGGFEDLSILGGATAEGGGIYSVGALRVYDSTIERNWAVGGAGGAAISISGNGGPGGEFGVGGTGGDSEALSGDGGDGLGGGVYVGDGSALFVNTTVEGNSSRPGKPGTATAVQGDPGGGFPGMGGSAGTATATVSTNRSLGAGGLWLDPFEKPTVTLRDDTVAHNSTTATLGGGNLTMGPHSAVVIDDTIIADPQGHARSCRGHAHAASFSLVDDHSCGMSQHSDQIGKDPRLGHLRNNGGDVDTMSLPVSSPAVDAGRSFGEHQDARGDRRPVDIASIHNAKGGGGADIGAYERQRPPGTTITAHPSRRTRSRKATVKFVGSRSAVGFQCRVGRGHWRPCSSPRKLRHLAIGDHVFRVRAVDVSRLRDPTPATVSWTVTSARSG